MKAFQVPSALLRAKRRAQHRRSSSGGTMFVVAMTLAVLFTVGAWALQSAALEVRTAGYERQSTQTHYLAEYGVMEAMQNLTPYTLPNVAPVAVCGNAGVHPACLSVPCLSFSASPVSVLGGTGCSAITAPLAPLVQTCFKFSTFPAQSVPFLDPASDAGLSGPAGSLGATSTQGSFTAEFTDLSNAPAAAGFSGTGQVGGVSSYWGVVTSYGQTTTAGSATSQGTELLRTRLKVGPIPTINLGVCN